MCRIQNRITNVSFSACQTDIFVGIRMFVMRLPAGQVAVIVVLMDDHDRWGAVDDSPFFLTRLVDHPVVPTGATDGEVRNIGVTGTRKQEKVTSSRAMKPSLMMDCRCQVTLPTFAEFNVLSHF